MLSQWECFLQNLGSWHGSFTRISPQGEELEDTPTIVSFTGLEDNRLVRQIVRRQPPNQPPREQVFEYRSFGKNILFFDNGAFSIGAVFCSQFSPPWAELGLIAGKQRLRVVQIFGQDRRLDYLTLIREHLDGTPVSSRPNLTLDQLLGEWQGKAITMYPDLRNPDISTTHLQLQLQGSQQLLQKLTFTTAEAKNRTITSVAQINGSKLFFDQGELPKRLLMLPDGCSAHFPAEVKFGQPFFLEIGWLLEPGKRERMIRSYNAQGEWASLTLVQEQKLS